MSRRLLNNSNLGMPAPTLPVENVFEMVKPTPIPVRTYTPSTPIFLTQEQWNAICDKTQDATVPFSVTVTVVDKSQHNSAEKDDEINLDELKEGLEPYVPKKTRKTKK
jgi:hypothetical protein